MVGKAASQPRRPIVVLGIWLMFGPPFLSSLIFGGMIVAGGGFGGGFADVAGLVVCLATGLLSGAILYKTTMSYLDQRRPLPSNELRTPKNGPQVNADQPPRAAEETSCLKCGQLIPLEASICSHCGWSFDDPE